MNDKEKRDKIKLTYKLNWDNNIKKSLLDYYAHNRTDEIINKELEEAQAKRDNINSHKIIHIGLYGGKSIFGGKEQKIRARIVRCKKFNTCSLYSLGLCMRDTKCIHAIVNEKVGYTSRANKYHEFKREWESHEMYGKLKQSYKDMWLIDGVLYWKFANIQLEEDLTLKTSLGFMSGNGEKISVDKLDLKLLKSICLITPTRSYMDGYGKVKGHDKTIANFLIGIKELLPSLYNEFIKLNKEFDKQLNYVGKNALIHTINIGDVKLSSSVAGNWDGEFITVKDNKPIWAIGDDVETIRTIVKPGKQFKVEITRNDQVNDKTKFI